MRAWCFVNFLMFVEFSFSMGWGSIYYHFDSGQYSERKMIWVPLFFVSDLFFSHAICSFQDFSLLLLQRWRRLQVSSLMMMWGHVECRWEIHWQSLPLRVRNVYAELNHQWWLLARRKILVEGLLDVVNTRCEFWFCFLF